MTLIDIPSELLDYVFSYLVHSVGMKETARLRLVNKTFDQFAQHAIFGLPSFEDNGPWDVGLSQRAHPKMPPEMMERLILMKLSRADADRRPLTNEILCTASYMLQLSSPAKTTLQEYQCGLARMAAATLSVRDVVRYLSKTNKSLPEPNLALNALVCTVALEAHLPESYFYVTTSFGDMKTSYFGGLFSAAVRGGQVILRKVLETCPKPTTALAKRLRSLRLGEALMSAVELKRDSMVTLLLLHDFGAPGWRSRHRGEATARAFEIGHLECSRVLCRDLRHNSDLDLRHICDHALRLAIRNGHEQVVRMMVEDEMAGLEGGHIRQAALEDACRYKSHTILDFLLKCWPHEVTHLTSRSNAVYWAGRVGDIGVLNTMLSAIWQHEAQKLPCVLDALAGAAFHGLEATKHVLEYLDCCADSMEPSTPGIAMFCSAVDILMSRKGVQQYQTPDAEQHSESGSGGGPVVSEARGAFDPPLLTPFAPKTAVNAGDVRQERRKDRSTDIRSTGVTLPLDCIPLRRYCLKEDVLAVYQWLCAQTDQGDQRIFQHACGKCAEITIAQNRPGLYMLLQKNAHPAGLSVSKFRLTLRLRHSFRAASTQRSTAMFQALFDAGWIRTNASGSDRRQRTPLSLVLGDPYITQWYLEHNADPNGPGFPEDGTTAMTSAVGSLATLQKLVDYGGDVHRGQLLHEAVHRTDRDVLSEHLLWLLDHHVSVNERWDGRAARRRESFVLPPSGMTALQIAAARGKLEACELLLRYGADPNIRSGNGTTAIRLAEERGHWDVVDFLKKWPRD